MVSEKKNGDLGRVGLNGAKRFAGMIRGCPDLQNRVGGVVGGCRNIFRWPELLPVSGFGVAGEKERERRER